MVFAPCEMKLESEAFENGALIPQQYTGEGEDISPHLAWENPPEGTKAFALFCHDPDAPVVDSGSYGFNHWVLYNLSGSCTGLGEGSEEGTSGLNGFGNPGYGGPMPPEGHGTHNYFFVLLALDAELELGPGLTQRQLLEAVENHVIGVNRLFGTYRRG